MNRFLKQAGLLCNKRGFTLLELLISITLLMLIVFVTMGTLRLGSKSITSGQKRMEIQERFRTALAVMDAQIQSQMPLAFEEEGSKKYYFRGDRRSVRLSTNYSIWDGLKGYVITDYRVETDESGRKALFASEQTPGIEGKRETMLIEPVTDIYFEYFYKSPLEREGKWIEQLTEGRALPERIRIHIVHGEKKTSLMFPTRVKGEMLPVEAASSRTTS